MKLSELKTGEKGVIIKVLGHGGFRRRIIEMGFIKGKNSGSGTQCTAQRPHQIQNNGLRSIPPPTGSRHD